jgi:hypothetical protein
VTNESRIAVAHDDLDRDLALVVERALVGALAAAWLDQLTVVRIDGHFGPKWHRFAGKVLGALGIARPDERLAPPPFVPARVVRQDSFTATNGRLDASTSILEALHVELASSSNTRRRMDTLAPQRVVAWLGGGRPDDDRAALMCHVVTPDSPASWYVELCRDPKWRVTHPRGISRREFESLVLLGSRPSAVDELS